MNKRKQIKEFNKISMEASSVAQEILKLVDKHMFGDNSYYPKLTMQYDIKNLSYLYEKLHNHIINIIVFNDLDTRVFIFMLQETSHLATNLIDELFKKLEEVKDEDKTEVESND